MRSMSLEPSQRPQSATELEHALLAFCRPNFRDHMIERMSQSNMGVKSSSPLLPTPQIATVAAKPSAMKRSSKLPLVIAGVAALGIAGAVFAATQRSEDKPAQVVMPSTGPAIEPPPTPVVETKPPVVESLPVEPAAPAAPVKVTLRFDIVPKTAKIAIDGTPIDGAQLEVDKDDKTHKVTITAKGFQPYEEDVSFSETQKLVVKLDKVGQKPTNRPRKPPGAKDGKPAIIDTKSPYD